MPYSTIDKASANFDTNLYTANGSGKTISGMDFQPTLVWTKNRDSASFINAVVDQVRGGTKKLFPNSTAVESTDTNAITAWTSDGYTFGSSGSFNYSTNNYVNWCWKGAGSGSSNSNGSITSTVSANAAGGFSVVKYTGTGSNGTVGHGLGVIPKMIITKTAGSGGSWCVYHAETGNTKALFLEDTGTGHTHADYWNNTSPTNQVFYVGGGVGTNHSGNQMIAYCFADVTGYCKVGRYVGNGSTDGAMVHTGFKPSLVLYKNISQTDEWFVKDNKRPGHNPTDLMFWSADNAETSLDRMNLFANGFKATTTDKGANVDGNGYIYLAIGQTLVGSNNIPSTAF